MTWEGETTWSKQTVQYAIQMTSFHLPDVYRTVRTSNYHEIIQWSPFDGYNREKMSWSKNDAFPLR